MVMKHIHIRKAKHSLPNPLFHHSKQLQQSNVSTMHGSLADVKWQKKLLSRKVYWIFKLNTRYPFGLNYMTDLSYFNFPLYESTCIYFRFIIMMYCWILLCKLKYLDKQSKHQQRHTCTSIFILWHARTLIVSTAGLVTNELIAYTISGQMVVFYGTWLHLASLCCN